MEENDTEYDENLTEVNSKRLINFTDGTTLSQDMKPVIP